MEEATVAPDPIANMQAQLLKDMEQFGDLMNRYAVGDTAVKEERDQLEGAVEIKLAILEGLKREEEELIDLDPLEELMEVDGWEFLEEEDEEW